MSRFRKIDPRIWNDKKFMAMTANGQLACIFLMTHPHMTSVGGLRATIPGVASEHPKIPEKAFKEAFEKGIAKEDQKAPLIWFPNFLKYNPPENPNVVKAWAKSMDDLPECGTKDLIYLRVKDFLKGFSEGFKEAWPQPLPKQEQEQEQEQEQDNTPYSPPEEKPKNSKFSPPTVEQTIQFFIENGFSESSARKAHAYYQDNEWKDSRNNPVKNWKQKMRGVWFKDENRAGTDKHNGFKEKNYDGTPIEEISWMQN
jgi:hypothetical protein